MTDRDDADPGARRAGEPCRGCGAPLAADQRYCLNCGRGAASRGSSTASTCAGDGGAKARPPTPAAARVTGLRAEEKPPARLWPARRGRRDRRARADAAGRRPDRQGRPATSTGRRSPRSSAKAAAAATRPRARSGEDGVRMPRSERSGKAEEAAELTPARWRRQRPRTGKCTVASDDDLQRCRNRAPRTTQRTAPELPDEIATPGGAAADRQTTKRPAVAAGGTAIE